MKIDNDRCELQEMRTKSRFRAAASKLIVTIMNSIVEQSEKRQKLSDRYTPTEQGRERKGAS